MVVLLAGVILNDFFFLFLLYSLLTLQACNECANLLETVAIFLCLVFVMIDDGNSILILNIQYEL